MALREARVSYAGLAEVVTPYNKIMDVPFLMGAWSLDSPAGIGAFSKEMARQSLMNGYLSAFYLFSFLALAAIPLIALIQMPRNED